MKRDTSRSEFQVRNQSDCRSLAARRLLKQPLRGGIKDTHDPNIRSLYVEVGEPDENYVDGKIDFNTDSITAHILMAEVTPEMAGEGIGTKLVKAFIATTKHYGAQELLSDITTNVMLHIHAKVLGEYSLKFYDPQHMEAGMLPMTYEQAWQSNERLHTVDTDQPDRPDPE